MGVDKKVTKQPAKASKGFTDEERAAIRERAKEQKAAASKADGERDLLEKIAAMSAPDRAMAERLHAIITASAPSPRAEDLVRDARLCQGRQDRLLLPTRGEVQDEVRDAGLQRQCQPRRRRPVADRLRAEGVDRRRRGEDRGAREESGELRARYGDLNLRRGR